MDTIYEPPPGALRPEWKASWAMFFTAVKSWQYHPGNKTPLTTAECAEIADGMLAQLIKREDTWDGWQQPR